MCAGFDCICAADCQDARLAFIGCCKDCNNIRCIGFDLIAQSAQAVRSGIFEDCMDIAYAFNGDGIFKQLLDLAVCKLCLQGFDLSCRLLPRYV